MASPPSPGRATSSSPWTAAGPTAPSRSGCEHAGRRGGSTPRRPRLEVNTSGESPVLRLVRRVSLADEQRDYLRAAAFACELVYEAVPPTWTPLRTPPSRRASMDRATATNVWWRVARYL